MVPPMDQEAVGGTIDGTTDGSGRMVQPETHSSALTVEQIDFLILFN